MKYHGQALGTHLIKEGLCPKNARAIELHVPANGAVVLRYEVFVDDEDLDKLQRALAATVLQSRKAATS